MKHLIHELCKYIRKESNKKTDVDLKLDLYAIITKYVEEVNISATTNKELLKNNASKEFEYTSLNAMRKLGESLQKYCLISEGYEPNWSNRVEYTYRIWIIKPHKWVKY